MTIAPQSQGPVEANIEVYRDIFVEQVGPGGGHRLPSTVEAPGDRVAHPTRCLAHNQVQHWPRRVLSLQKDLRQAVPGQHSQVLASRCTTS